MPRIAALLAAGGGTRFGGSTHKLLAPLDGRPVWHHALEAVAAAMFDRIVLVTGAVDLVVPPALASRVERLHHAAWADGQAGSLQVAVAAARAAGADALTVGLADQPFIPTSAWNAVATAPPQCRVVVAEYDGLPGPHPVRLAAAVWPELPTTGDHGAGQVIREHADDLCRVACLGSAADIDTLEDLDRWNGC